MGVNLRRRLNPSKPVQGRLPLTTASIRQPQETNGFKSTSRNLIFLAAALLVMAAVFVVYSKTNVATTTTRTNSLSLVVPLKPPVEGAGVYSVIVVGSGPAGLSAALFAARASLSVLVFGSTSGGLLSQATDLDNFPSFAKGNSMEWLQDTQQQAARAGASFALPGWDVTSLKDTTHQTAFTLQTSSNQTFSAKSVIIATGATPRRLHLGETEDKLWGKTIHSCAVCDAGSYGPDDTVLVVGGGDAAVSAALYLARSVQKVIMVHRQAELTRPKNQQAVKMLKATDNIELKTPYRVKAWRTTTNFHGMLELAGATLVHATDSTLTETIDCPGAFLMIGATPNTDWLSSSAIKLDADGFVDLSATGSSQATSVTGVFAAGEVAEAGGRYRQAITAAAQGAQAAMDAERWLASLPKDGSRPVLPATPVAKKQQQQQQQPQRQVERKGQQLGDLYNDCDDLVEKDCITSLVNAFPVVVFSKPWCPYCMKALEVLTAEGVGDSRKIHVVDLTKYETDRQIRNTLKSLTGRHSVPNVFVGGTSIGGGDETVELHQQGKLKEILRKAGAIG